MLEGHNSDWTDAGNRRQEIYNDLPPRNYRFRVTASNNSGVGNEAGASFDFGIAPAYYQTTWFLASCVAAGLALLAALYPSTVPGALGSAGLPTSCRRSARNPTATSTHMAFVK
jgi:hypothetical protein